LRIQRHFKDQLEIQFDVPAGTSEATLVLHAINTELITEVYRSLGSLLGDATLEFYYALEHDQQLQATVKEWTRQCGLRIEVAQGKEWIVAGVMLPEANAVPFTRALRIHNLETMHGSLRLRLSSLTDVWRIDALALDCSTAKPLPLQLLTMMSAISSEGQNCKEMLSSDDSSYTLVLPPHYVDITFDAVPTTTMQRPVFVCAAKGYLYEWFPQAVDSSFTFHNLNGGNRITMLKLLINQKDIFLPPIYAGWQKTIIQRGI
jgi:hypothetical protein